MSKPITKPGKYKLTIEVEVERDKDGSLWFWLGDLQIPAEEVRNASWRKIKKIL